MFLFAERSKTYTIAITTTQLLLLLLLWLGHIGHLSECMSIERLAIKRNELPQTVLVDDMQLAAVPVAAAKATNNNHNTDMYMLVPADAITDSENAENMNKNTIDNMVEEDAGGDMPMPQIAQDMMMLESDNAPMVQIMELSSEIKSMEEPTEALLPAEVDALTSDDEDELREELDVEASEQHQQQNIAEYAEAEGNAIESAETEELKQIEQQDNEQNGGGDEQVQMENEQSVENMAESVSQILAMTTEANAESATIKIIDVPAMQLQEEIATTMESMIDIKDKEKEKEQREAVQQQETALPQPEADGVQQALAKEESVDIQIETEEQNTEESATEINITNELAAETMPTETVELESVMPQQATKAPNRDNIEQQTENAPIEQINQQEIVALGNADTIEGMQQTVSSMVSNETVQSETNDVTDVAAAEEMQVPVTEAEEQQLAEAATATAEIATPVIADQNAEIAAASAHVEDDTVIVQEAELLAATTMLTTLVTTTQYPVSIVSDNYMSASSIAAMMPPISVTHITQTNGSFSADLRRYDGAQVWRIVVQNDKDRKYADELQTKYDGQLWKEIKQEVDYLLKPQVLAAAEQHVRRANLSRIVLIDNLQQVIEAENPPSEQIAQLQNRKGHRLTWQAYHRLEDIHGFIDYMAKTYPDICSTEIIGYSIEKRPLKILKISNGNMSNPSIWLDGGMHAREWISPATVTYIANQLIEGWEDLPSVLRQFNYYIHPVANPDGYEYSHTTDRLWRKNMRSHGRQCPGVDLNRNFGYKWGGKGTSASPCSQTYRGSKAFSEPETFYISKFISSYPKNTFQAYVSFHSYGQYILYPWGYDYHVTQDHADLDRVARQAGTSITKLTGVKYTVGSSASTLYPAAGGSDDWAKGIAGIKYTYTIEMGDTGRYGFVLPAKFIHSNGKDGYTFVEIVARAIATEQKTKQQQQRGRRKQGF